MTRRRREGQVVVLFALVLMGLIGVMALVSDVGMKYSFERRYQALADAAALAGAQQLQPASRTAAVTPTMQDYARRQALKSLADELVPGVAVTCADYADCPLPGGRFTVSIITPSPNCSACTPNRSVQVTVREPGHRTIFAALYGQPVWPLARTSVAGLSFGAKYTLVALRPPRPRNGSSIEVRDVFLNGGSQVFVKQGDVGTNANMGYGSTTNTLLSLDPGYRMYYYDPDPGGPDWGANPPGTRNGVLIADPKYPVPTAPLAPVSSPVAAGSAGTPCGIEVTTKILSQPKYADPTSEVVPRDNLDAIEWNKIWCYEPGTYGSPVQDSQAQQLTVLKPGLYRFEGGLDVNNAVVGGYDSTVGGVTLMFPRTKQFFQRAGSVVVLNAGSKYLNSTGSEPATAPAMTGGSPSVKITLIVDWDFQCVVAEPYNSNCHDPGTGGGSDTNQSLNLGGGAGIYLAGVQYAPSDNVKVAGNTTNSTGYIGQVWAWTIEYVGSTTVNLQGSSSDGPGKIRIDTACSPGEPPC